MATVSVTLTFASPQDMLAFFGGSPAPAVAHAAAAPSMPAAPAPSVAPSALATTAYPSSAPAMPAPAAAPAGEQYTVQTIQPLMQQYAATFKPAGLKAAFAKHGLEPVITKLDQNGLNVMGAFLKSMQPA